MAMPKKQKTNMPAKAAARLDERKMSIAGAAVGAVGMGLMGFGGMMSGWGYGMMGRYYGGYGFTPLALVSGLLWGAVIGAVGGYVLAWAYNKA